MRYRVIHRGHH